MSLKQEFEFYVANQAELLKQYAGQVVVIKDCKVHGAYKDEITAMTEAQKTFELGTFLVQRVEAGTQGYTETFYSRVSFA